VSSGIASGGIIDLLGTLPHEERDCVLKHSEHVTLTQDQILSEPGERIQHAYFPIDSTISLMVGVDLHDTLGIALVGSEGMLDTSLILGIHTSDLRARVQGPGSALRMAAEDFQRLRIETPMLERRLLLYLHLLFAQMAQTALCAAFHLVEMRLACSLLMIHDRAHADHFYLTHDRLARMLGVRRSGVSTAAGVLQARKLIRYTRGHVAILDRVGLERAACDCYQAGCSRLHQLARTEPHREALKDGRAVIRPRRRVPPGSGNHSTPGDRCEDAVELLDLSAAAVEG